MYNLTYAFNPKHLKRSFQLEQIYYFVQRKMLFETYTSTFSLSFPPHTPTQIGKAINSIKAYVSETTLCIVVALVHSTVNHRYNDIIYSQRRCH